MIKNGCGPVLRCGISAPERLQVASGHNRYDLNQVVTRYNLRGGGGPSGCDRITPCIDQQVVTVTSDRKSSRYHPIMLLPTVPVATLRLSPRTVRGPPNLHGTSRRRRHPMTPETWITEVRPAMASTCDLVTGWLSVRRRDRQVGNFPT